MRGGVEETVQVEDKAEFLLAADVAEGGAGFAGEVEGCADAEIYEICQAWLVVDFEAVIPTYCVPSVCGVDSVEGAAVIEIAAIFESAIVDSVVEGHEARSHVCAVVYSDVPVADAEAKFSAVGDGEGVTVLTKALKAPEEA